MTGLGAVPTVWPADDGALIFRVTPAGPAFGDSMPFALIPSCDTCCGLFGGMLFCCIFFYTRPHTTPGCRSTAG